MDKILILDFGSQVTQLIARRVREAHVYCELNPFDMPIDEIRAFAPKAIILSGGPNSVYESDYQADPAAAEALSKVGAAPAPAGLDKASLAAWTHVARVLLNLHESITRS